MISTSDSLAFHQPQLGSYLQLIFAHFLIAPLFSLSRLIFPLLTMPCGHFTEDTFRGSLPVISVGSFAARLKSKGKQIMILSLSLSLCPSSSLALSLLFMCQKFELSWNYAKADFVASDFAGLRNKTAAAAAAGAGADAINIFMSHAPGSSGTV